MAALPSSSGTEPSDSASRESKPPVLSHAATTVGILAGTVAITVGVAGFLFQLIPGLQPTPPPRVLSADIEKITVDPNVRLWAYATRFQIQPELRQLLLRNVGRESSHPAQIVRLQLAYPGVVAYVKVRVIGFHRQLKLPQAFLYNARSLQRLPHPYDNLSNFANALGAGFRPRAGDDQGVAAIFVVCPRAPESLVLGVELRDDRDRLVDVARSSEFRCSLRVGQ
jgi:hypothetical protein